MRPRVLTHFTFDSSTLRYFVQLHKGCVANGVEYVWHYFLGGCTADKRGEIRLTKNILYRICLLTLRIWYEGSSQVWHFWTKYILRVCQASQSFPLKTCRILNAVWVAWIDRLRRCKLCDSSPYLPLYREHLCWPS